MWPVFPFCLFSVFTIRGLEKVPTHKVPAMETFRMSKPGAKTGCSTSEKEMFLERIMHRMRQRANERRVLVKPCFQDFDKYVTKHRLPPLRIFYIKGSFAGLRMPEGLWTRKLSYKLGIYRPALFK